MFGNLGSGIGKFPNLFFKVSEMVQFLRKCKVLKIKTVSPVIEKKLGWTALVKVFIVK